MTVDIAAAADLQAADAADSVVASDTASGADAPGDAAPSPDTPPKNDLPPPVDAAQDAAPDAPPDVAKPDVAPADIAADVKADTAADIAADTAPDAAKDSAADVADPFGDANSCGAEKDCKGGQMCIAPGESIGCGMCMLVKNPCADNAACPAASVCKPQQCACGGEKTCQPGCKVEGTAACPQGTFCAPTGECVAKVCMVVDPPGADKNCPLNFVCTNPANPKCQRKPCTASSQCQGACVKGLCYDKAGFCSYPPP